MKLILSTKDQDRFWEKVDKSDPKSCWLWQRYLNNKGYGKFSLEGEPVYAHRLAYQMEVGPIPQGTELDHLCSTPACVNPSHLESVTHTENVRRGKATKTHCLRGHPRTPENLQGWNCKICSKEYAKKYREENRERDAEKISAYQKEYRTKNLNKLKENHKKYYQKNKEELNAKKKVYTEQNKEKTTAYQKEYYRKNREKLLAYQKDRYVSEKVQ